jgi:hypothetical protein
MCRIQQKPGFQLSFLEKHATTMIYTHTHTHTPELKTPTRPNIDRIKDTLLVDSFLPQRLL